MARRMIDPTIIKSKIVNDKMQVDLMAILNEYGVQTSMGNSITLQIYAQEVLDDGGTPEIVTDTGGKAFVMTNTAITITQVNYTVYIRGLLVDNSTDMNLMSHLEILDGDYENGITLSDNYPFDVHVIKV